MSTLKIEKLNKSYGQTSDLQKHALKDVELDISGDGIFCLLGPSGSGKTTLLRSIAGTIRPDAGRITVGGRVLYDKENRINLPPEERGIGMVFQNLAVWPHMTVQRHLSFVLETSRYPDQRGRTSKIDAMLEMCGLTELRSQLATELSGGQNSGFHLLGL